MGAATAIDEGSCEVIVMYYKPTYDYIIFDHAHVRTSCLFTQLSVARGKLVCIADMGCCSSSMRQA